MKHVLIFSLFWVMSLHMVGQSLPVGFPQVEDALRRNQLRGKADSSISFALKPIPYPADSFLTMIQSHKLRLTLISFKKNLGKIYLLPFQANFEYNSHHPYPSYNGAMKPSKGLQGIISPGIAGNIGPLRFRLRPEVLFSKNEGYPGFPTLEDETSWPHYKRWRYMYRWWNNIDIPESFSNEPETKFLLGQSYLSFNYRHVALAVSTQNLWWGPGRYGSLLMTNNAEAFPHISLNTSSPIGTPIGTFESQLIVGNLSNSSYLPPDTFRTYNNEKLYIPKYEDDRIINGLSLTYQPKWVNGLFIGFGRVVQMYSSTARHYKDYLPVITDLFRSSDYLKDTLVRNDIASVFLRWAWQNSEIYFEYGRNSASWKLQDLISAPQHDAAYVLGFSRLIPLHREDEFFEISMEGSKLQQPADYILGLLKAQSWYTHEVIRHGYTNHGEVIANRVGPGGNMQVARISWIKNLDGIGVHFERLVHNNDFNNWTFYGTRGGDFRSYWVDYSIGLVGHKAYRSVLSTLNIQYTRSLNYQWETVPNKENFSKKSGVDVNNLFIRINAAYLF